VPVARQLTKPFLGLAFGLVDGALGAQVGHFSCPLITFD
jgi:hypothetical protein